MVGQDEQKFKTADLDKNGSLDEKEFAAFVHPHEFEYMHDLEIAHALKDHDKNNDGKIELSEYRTEVNESKIFRISIFF